jgi:nucleotide-binding universal stress UspA family protein
MVESNMTIATVLTLVTDESESESTLKTAIAVGLKFGAYVEALHVRAEPESVIPVVAGGMAAESVHVLLEGARSSTAERAERAHRLFQNVVLEMSLPLTKVDVEPEVGRFSTAWCETTGIESREIVRRGRLFDLTVLARPHDGYDQTSSTALTAALFETGRPILIAPPEVPATVGQRLMLAWHDTREAAEGVWAAMPFATKADEVTVVSVTEANSSVDPDGLVRALARHGIAAEGQTLARGKASVGESLLATADQRTCDLLVMGAYGHSRLQELILGGATKHVLKHAQIPLLMVH